MFSIGPAIGLPAIAATAIAAPVITVDSHTMVLTGRAKAPISRARQ